ncbi:MAG: alpha/beta hydrolase [Candidatus Zixiibacteriota bacterium]
MSNSRFAACLVCLLGASIVWLAIGCQKETPAPATQTQTTPPVVATVDSVRSADSVMIYFDSRGQGEQTLVFVHCWSCDRTYWRNQVDEFARDYRVVSIDLGGHGQSGLERKRWNMASYGVDVAAVVEKLNLQNMILIGHSMGGPVVIEAARLLPGRVAALVGVDNFQDFSTTYTDEQAQGFVNRLRQPFKKNVYQFVQSMFPQSVDTSLANRIANDMASAPDDVALSSLFETVRYNYRSALADVRLPIRTISSDKYPTYADANGLIAASFAVRIMSGSGHFPHLEDPATFNRLLRETIAEFWPRPAER